MILNIDQVKNLCLLADFMEGLVDPKFTMAIYTHSCGAPACALGWACTLPRFRAMGLHWVNDSWQRIFGGPEIHHKLFSHTLAYRIKTPQQWAAHCRAFLKENGYEAKDPFKTFMDRALAPVETEIRETS